jgi:anti-sigma28 factor (negative regulator of flagellin synthesis)
MDAIVGIGRISEPGSVRQTKARDRRYEDEIKPAQDGIQISSAARESAGMAKAAQSAIPDVRQERVDEAKASIEKGVYKLQEVVRYVASRVAHFV